MAYSHIHSARDTNDDEEYVEDVVHNVKMCLTELKKQCKIILKSHTVVVVWITLRRVYYTDIVIPLSMIRVPFHVHFTYISSALLLRS